MTDLFEAATRLIGHRIWQLQFQGQTHRAATPRPPWLVDAYDTLDAAVAAVYGWSAGDPARVLWTPTEARQCRRVKKFERVWSKYSKAQRVSSLHLLKGQRSIQKALFVASHPVDEFGCPPRLSRSARGRITAEDNDGA